jgi:ElaB/YqjD/DUF883 family membrane-anchored ribosome-binding protein
MASTYEKTAEDNKARLGEQATRVMGDLRELGHTAASTAAETARGLRTQSAEALEAGKNKAVEMRDGLATKVSDNPWKSVLIAAGVGALIGFIVRRAR